MPTSFIPTTSPAITRAQELLAEAHLENEWPVPLEKLAEHLGYKCFGFDGSAIPGLEDVSGQVDYEGKSIYINTKEPLARQRFTLAHEIAHAVLHPGEAPVDFRSKMLTSVDPKEVEANKFAVDLLMDPLKFIRKWLELKGDMKAIASYFGVSPEAAAVRVSYLGLDRA